MSSVIAVIPARGGSKGLPGKNIRMIHGRPLIAWSIAQALAAGITRVVVSTDDEAIAAVARDHGADVPFIRPAHLATDTAATEPVMLHALDWYADNGETFDTIMLLQPTSPLRLTGSIDRALDHYHATDADSLLGVCENHYFFWRAHPAVKALYDYRHRPRRQDIADEDRVYRENGSLYLTRVPAFREHRNRLCGKIELFLMDEAESLEIDSATDFATIEAVMKATDYQC